MLICPAERWCFVHVPRTAGTSVVQALSAGRYVQNRDEHGCHPPKGYWTFTVVRDPRTRLPSLYAYRKQYFESAGDLDVSNTMFRSFFTYLNSIRLLGPPPGCPWDWLQCRFLRHCRLDAVLRFESLTDDLRGCGLLADDQTLHHLQRSDGIKNIEHAPGLINMIEDICQDDLEIYGY